MVPSSAAFATICRDLPHMRGCEIDGEGGREGGRGKGEERVEGLRGRGRWKRSRGLSHKPV